jgi:hypothetical protein
MSIKPGYGAAQLSPKIEEETKKAKSKSNSIATNLVLTILSFLS